MGNNSNKTKIVVKEKIVIEPIKPEKQKKQSWFKSCFGTKKTKHTNQKTIMRPQGPSEFIRDTRKSSILVKSKPFIQLDEKLFENREKKLLDIHMKRTEPYEILKNSDYFDSDQGEKSEIDKIKKTYETCEIANYQTPPTQKLQTVIVKTYLFDRNLTKLQN